MGRYLKARGLLHYECLSAISYRCGRIGHIENKCSYMIQEDDDEDLPYEEWILATTKAVFFPLDK